jgi:hypothetical protein
MVQEVQSKFAQTSKTQVEQAEINWLKDTLVAQKTNFHVQAKALMRRYVDYRYCLYRKKLLLSLRCSKPLRYTFVNQKSAQDAHSGFAYGAKSSISSASAT